MIKCPNCGYRHNAEPFAPELDGVRLQRKQADILLRLRQSRGAIVTAEQLVDFIWGDDEAGGPDDAVRCLWTHISKLRKNIAARGWTVTVERERGYRLVRCAA